MATLVYRYGIAAPHGSADLVLEQMRLAHEYRKRLVEIERARRAEARAAMTGASAEVRVAEERVRVADAECERLAGEIRAVRRAARKRAESTGAREALTAARNVKRDAQRALYELREAQRSQCAECRRAKLEENPCPHAPPAARALRLELDAIDARAAATAREARGKCGVFWGTYLIVERAMQASRSTPLFEIDGVTSHDPPFPRWDGSGAVAVQIQGGLPVKDVLAGRDARLQIDEPPWPEVWAAANGEFEPVGDADLHRGREPRGFLPGPKGTPLVRAPATRANGAPARWVRDRAVRHGEVRLRVQSEGRAPIWGAWRLDYHRPLPPDARVLWATVHRQMCGPHPKWSLDVTVEYERPVGVDTQARRPTVALDIGWRQVDGGLRVAAWRDSDGRTGELRLTAADVEALRQSSICRGNRDAAYDRCRMALARWISAAQSPPEWMREAARHMHQWRRAGRMVALFQRWAIERPDGKRAPDEEIAYRAVEAWLLADRHYWAEEAARGIWAIRRRRDKYRVFAAEMARRYDTIVLEHFDLRAVAERAQTGADAATNETARRNRQLVSLHDLRHALVNAAPLRGALVVDVDASNSTRTHAPCGVVADRGQAEQIMLHCDACRESFDQDVNAATVILTRYRENPGAAKILGGARAEGNAAKTEGKKDSRWVKARRLGAAKKARVEGAREAAPK